MLWDGAKAVRRESSTKLYLVVKKHSITSESMSIIRQFLLKVIPFGLKIR
jgi:hypothetical protein